MQMHMMILNVCQAVGYTRHDIEGLGTISLNAICMWASIEASCRMSLVVSAYAH